MRTEPAAGEHLLALADDEHFVGARHTAWIGLGPFLEEDLAFCSIAQDELGHALALYRHLLADGRAGGDRRDVDGRDVDHFALLREPGEYRSCWLTEAACVSWDDALVRHWLYDRAESLRWEALAGGRDQAVATIATKALRDESFHGDHAAQLMRRLASAAPIGEAVERLLPLALALWEPVAGEEAAIAAGLATASSDVLRAEWSDLVRTDLREWGIDAQWPAAGAVEQIRSGQDGRRLRSPAFAALQEDLRRVVDVDPAAHW